MNITSTKSISQPIFAWIFTAAFLQFVLKICIKNAQPTVSPKNNPLQSCFLQCRGIRQGLEHAPTLTHCPRIFGFSRGTRSPHGSLAPNGCQIQPVCKRKLLQGHFYRFLPFSRPRTLTETGLKSHRLNPAANVRFFSSDVRFWYFHFVRFIREWPNGHSTYRQRVWCV